MSRRLRDQSGFTLPELLTAIALFMFIMGATLDVFDGFVQRNRTNTKLNDAQDKARNAMDRMARQLRNLASPTNASVMSIDTESSRYDLVFQTVDPVKRRVRYCLDPGSPDAKLWMQTQAFPVTGSDPGRPPTDSCPDPSSAWATKDVMADRVVNRLNGADRCVFYFNGSCTPPDDTSAIRSIRAQLYIDVNPGKAPAETTIASGDFLRNQNQQPVIPDFTITQNPGSRRVILNGSGANDPEGRTLDYYWYRSAGSGSTSNLPTCQDDSTQTGSGFTCIGRGVTAAYSFLSNETGTPTITLKVLDPGGLSAIHQKPIPYSLP